MLTERVGRATPDGYAFSVQINWVGVPNASEAAATMEAAVDEMRKKKVANACPFDLPKKFWAYLLERAEIPADAVWLDLGKKAKNKLLNTLLNDVYQVHGKTTFKEEFVTCGGITLGEVDFHTMQSRVVRGLYFAGEVLDVDGVTGGQLPGGVDHGCRGALGLTRFKVKDIPSRAT